MFRLHNESNVNLEFLENQSSVNMSSNTKLNLANNNKKFVSLSDILMHEKFNSPNTLNRTPPTSQQAELSISSNNKLKISSEQMSLNCSKTMTENPTLVTNKTLNDELLTVQILFEELELDCDEQIKQLDSVERMRSEQLLKQRKILDTIKFISGKTSPISEQPKTICRKSKIRMRTQNIGNGELIPRMRRKKSEEKLVLNMFYRNMKFNFNELVISKTLTHRKYQVVLKLSDKVNYRVSCSRKRSFSLSLLELKTFFNENSVNFLHSILLKPVRLLIKSDLCSTFDIPKIEVSSENSLSRSNYNASHSQSLLDKYFDKYCRQINEKNLKACSSDNSSIAANDLECCKQLKLQQAINTNPDTTSEYSSMSSSSPLESIRNKQLNKPTATASSIAVINENAFSKNQEFSNLIEASKWLIQAGYSQYVHVFLSKTLYIFCFFLLKC